MKEIYILKEPLNKVTEPKEVFKKIKKFNIDYSQENFIVFYFNNNLQVLKSEILFKGGLDACMIDPKTLFRNALLVNAKHIILSHNHPSGHLKPSDEDLDIYKRLKDLGSELGLKVCDSVIFNKKEFYSLKNEEGGK